MVQPINLGNVITRLKTVTSYLTISFITISHIEYRQNVGNCVKRHMPITCTLDRGKTFLSACRTELTEINWNMADKKGDRFKTEYNEVTWRH
jgi:hypothetical protein